MTRCRLCWRITLAVFVAIFVVEAVILVPSYQNYQRDLLARLDEVGRGAVTASFALDGGSDRQLLDVGQTLTRVSRLTGGAIYTPGGTVIGTFGERPEITLETFRTLGAPGVRNGGGERFEAVWLPAETGLSVIVIGRLDASHIGPELRAFLVRIGGLVLLISVFVSAVTMVILGRSILLPLLTIRDNLVAAHDDPANADRHTLPEKRNDELGEVIVKLNELLRRVSKTYREELASMLQMVDHSADAMLVYDTSGRVVYANQACLALSGFDELEQMDQNGLPRFNKGGDTQLLKLTDLLDDGAYSGEVTLMGRYGRAVPCLISGARLEAENGDPYRYFASITDISELKTAYEYLERQNMELTASSRAKSEFLANMSHELRTPLNAIIGFSEIIRTELKGPIGNAEYRDFSNHIHESGTHLLMLIDDILDLSKIEAGQFELDEETIDPREAIDSCLRLVHGRAEAHRITIETRIDANISTLYVDARKFKQILINILSNAVKFTPDDGGVRVGASCLPTGEFAIEIVDTGVGISEDDLARVFVPFVQSDGSLNRQYEGSGLGLPLPKSMVELHGGALTLDSREGEGTTVTVVFPANRVQRNSTDDALAVG